MWYVRLEDFHGGLGWSDGVIAGICRREGLVLKVRR